jgi:hypothetical protein
VSLNASPALHFVFVSVFSPYAIGPLHTQMMKGSSAAMNRPTNLARRLRNHNKNLNRRQQRERRSKCRNSKHLSHRAKKSVDSSTDS